MSDALIEAEGAPLDAPGNSGARIHYNTIIRNVLANWTWQVLVVASGLILPRFIGQRHGPEMLGVWDLGWSLSVYVTLLTLGLVAAITRYVAHYRVVQDWDSLNAIVNTGFVILCALSFLGAAAAVGFALLTPHMLYDTSPEVVAQTRWIILVLGLSSVMQFPRAVFQAILGGYERYDLINLVRGILDFLLLVSMLVLLKAGFGLIALAWVAFVVEIPSLLAQLWLSYKVCPHLRLRLIRLFHWRIAHEMIVFGSKAILQSISNSILYQLNGIIISACMGPAVLAVYSRQRVLLLQGMRFIRQYASVLVPSTSSWHATGDMHLIQRLLVQSSKYGMYLAVPLMVMLSVMGGPLVDVWMRPGYRAPVVLAIMAAGHLLYISQQGVYSILMGMGRHGLPALFELAGAILSVILGLILVWAKGYGMIGGALAMAIPVMISGGLVLPLYGCRLLGLSRGRYFSEMLTGPLLANIPFAAALLLARFKYPDAPGKSLAVGMLAGGAINVIIYWQWVLPPEIRSRLLARMGWRKRVILQSTPPAVSSNSATNCGAVKS